ncbi:1-deoxy-D-xylulose-5-phosphate synthase [bacterium]|nr:1-deoxy-D-xylulose-5-phosphate synthase [bacterium]
MVLESIKSYKDLMEMEYGDLKTLAQELREYIIETVAEKGGHLAPNLGVIELTIALLRVYDPRLDRIIWDVGHQSYPYKILTDRKDAFKSLRTCGGISGFPRMCESEYDCWGTGHASTSISAALGMAVSRDIKGENYKVVAVIGDGALTGGLAFEGLNNAGSSNSELLVILNDNEMSISENVGAIPKYLTEIITNPLYRKIKDEVWDVTGKLEVMAKPLRTMARKFQESIKNLIVPGMLFEELGFSYFGPIDGHNIKELERILDDIKDIKQPKILHIATHKGKGYKFAEDDAPKFHGIGAFDPETGEKTSTVKKKTYTEVFGEAMLEFAEKDDKLVAITAAMLLGTGLYKFSQKYPRRCFDVGIAEEHAVVFSAALANSGLNTVIAIYSTFLQRAFDQIIHDVALQKIPLTFAIDRAGIVGSDGPTHNGVFDLSYLRMIPNLVVAAPKDEDELRSLLHTALSWQESPFAIRYTRSYGTGITKYAEIRNLPPGTWEKISEGDDAVILACGSMVDISERALNQLKKDFSCELVNCRYIKPLDDKMLSELLSRFNRVITVEENTVLGGFGAAILEYAAKNKFNNKDILNIGITDEFVEHGSRDVILEKLMLDVNGVATQIKKFMKGN